MRKQKWLRFLVILPLLFAMVFTNVYIDPANIFHDYSKEIAESILKGNATHFGGNNVNEREIKHQIIKEMPDKIDCIAMGPSLVMGVRSETVDSDTFYNLGVSGADFYDIMAQFGMMEVYGKSVNRVIFCMDSYFFDETIYETFERNENLKVYADYMVNKMNKIRVKKPQENRLKEKETEIRQLFSITYFQAAVNYIQSQNEYIGDRDRGRWGVVDENYTGTYYLPDASWVYFLDYQNRTEKDVIEDSEKYNMEFQFSKGKHISEYSKEVFEKLVEYLRNKGIEIDLFLCPLAPSLWNRVEVEKDNYPILDELEEYANHVAKKYDLKITGSYNPYNMEMSDKDFYDARHVRHEMLGTYFNFEDKVGD